MRTPPRSAGSLLPLALLLALAGCPQPGAPARVEAPADPDAGEVPFTLAGPGGAVLMVPVHINGEGPFDFVLDTGATLTCVDRTLVERLALPERAGIPGVAVGVEGTGRATIVRVDSLRLGEARAYELSACELDLAHAGAIGLGIEGLLGLNFLRNFRVTLDFEHNILTLDEP